MREIFHGWRRKVGLVTLAMSLAVAGMWLRARVCSDSITFRIARHDALAFTLLDRSACCMWLSENEKSPKKQLVKHSNGRMQATAEYFIDPQLTVDWDWGSKEQPPMRDAAYSLDFAEFRLGVAQEELGNMRVLTMPYWSIATPLTLLSTYLILWKPRKRKSPQPAEI